MFILSKQPSKVSVDSLTVVDIHIAVSWYKTFYFFKFLISAAQTILHLVLLSCHAFHSALTEL